MCPFHISLYPFYGCIFRHHPEIKHTSLFKIITNIN
ncbi:hypothetical protein [Plasmodium yoelii yoelii]|uniref:Uncharacterized protein n=1 Tax=Plasmodium yoelii yoelii TaxID=73239 RepID=Q7RAB9_PLAYO|nr:hypothetical protein [Plasmodium yoelii yoelii]